MEIIDIHCHTSDHRLWGLHTESAKIFDLEKLAKKYLIKKIVLMATYFPFKGKGLPNQDLFSRIKGNKLFLMFGSLDIMNNFEKGIEELRALAEQEIISGIKLYPGYQNFNASDENIFPIYRLAAKFNLPVMFHTGELHHCCPWEKRQNKNYSCKNEFCWLDRLGHLSQPQAFIGAIKNFPEVKFVLSHLSNPYFSELQNLMTDFGNVYTDISGQFLSGTDEDDAKYRELIKDQVLRIIKIKSGIDRLMFGTDFPIQSQKDSIEMIKSLGLSEEDEKKVFYRNAAKLLNLKENEDE